VLATTVRDLAAANSDYREIWDFFWRASTLLFSDAFFREADSLLSRIWDEFALVMEQHGLPESAGAAELSDGTSSIPALGLRRS